MSKKIVITGMGAVTPVGIGVENYWQALISGKSGIADITGIDVSDLPVKIAAEVRNFKPKDYLSSRLVADLDRFMQFAYIAAQEALDESGLEIEPSRTGIVMGTALAGMTHASETQEELTANGKHVSPRFVSKILGNIAAAQFAIDHNIKGPCLTNSTACSSGGDAIFIAWMLLAVGAADAVVVMAGESTLNQLMIGSLFRAGALSKGNGSRPFDVGHDGFVIGEGGGALILETEEHALARGADIKAVLLGCANNTDAHHPVSPQPEGIGAADCMHIALESAGMRPEDIDYVNAHGTATVAGDRAETKAIKRVFGDRPVPVSSTKGATGHMMGAGGVTEVIACVKAIQTGILPQTVNHVKQDSGCDINIIANAPEHRQIKTAMSNALGFGGQNSSIIIGKYERG